MNTDERADCEYVVVGSGAGGGTLAARLAEAGHKVILLEAGGDPRALEGGDPYEPNENRLPDDYDVPAFHPFASENEAMTWSFFVRHYADDAQQRRDPKYSETWNGRRVDGVLYPRGAALGGCTAHNAMIFVYPHQSDWEHIADLTGDESWRADAMRSYFERIEACRYRPALRFLSRLRANPSRHGFDGWLQTEKDIPKAALKDKALVDVIRASAHEAFDELGERVQRIRSLLETKADPNDWRSVTSNAVGVCYTPLTTRGHRRIGSRERVLDVARRFPDRLIIELGALATRVLFDENQRAYGVEYMLGNRLYRASAKPSGEPGEKKQVIASREVILAGGAFNTPQLLMLSGVGPRDVLEQHGITVRVELPGVGKNLQDRYEVGVVNRMNFDPWNVLQGARFSRGDPQYTQWAGPRGAGVYGTNAAVLAVIKKSAPERPLPDLFCFALLGNFRGYFPGYSTLFPGHLNYLTWAILKGHTQNRCGEVTVRSADPRDPPNVNFRYFEEGCDTGGEDLESVVAGVKFVRRMTAGLKKRKLIAEEELPGDHVQSDDEIRQFVRDQAWGHHASCSCPIGPREQGGVVSSDFRVHGTSGLRIVDASVFPRIPGFFIVSAVYMIGEKAADVILADAARGPG